MDFSRISQAGLSEYLQANGVTPSGNLVQQAAAIYEPESRTHRWTATVLDLYLATEFMRLNPDVRFTWDYFNSLGPVARRETGEMVGLNPDDPAFETRLNHIGSLLSAMSAEKNRQDNEAQLALEFRRDPQPQRTGAVGVMDTRKIVNWYDQFDKQRCFRELRCLTFNICNECMAKPVCTYTCFNNIAAYIGEGDTYDFIALQEASRWNEIPSSRLALMTAVQYQPGTEKIVTLYRERYRLDSGVSVIKSWLQDQEAPMIVLFFPGVCVINIQAGTGTGFFRKRYDFYELDNHFAAALRAPTTSKPGTIFTVDGKEMDRLDLTRLNEVMQRLRSSHIIILGDFHAPLGNLSTYRIFQDTGRANSAWRSDTTRTLVGFHDVPTCCNAKVETTQANAKSGAYDQIVVTTPGLVVEHEIPIALPQASDHLPVRAKVLLPY